MSSTSTILTGGNSARPSLPDLVAEPDGGMQSKQTASIKWIHLLLLGVAFGALFWVNLQRLWQLTNPSSGDPNWGHAIFIPLISLAYLLEHRDSLKRAPARPSFAGILVLLTGIILFVGGIGLSVDFAQFGIYLQDVAMLVTLLGCVLAVFGWPMVRITAFPIAYLLCALPWPPYVHDAMTVPLQHLAATASVHVLQLTGMNVEQAGNTIHILTASGVDRALNVAEACSGMRSLITFIAIGLAVAFLSVRPLWQRIIISLAAIPIAVACNIFRIVGEGLLDQHVSRSLSEGFAHAAIGVVLLAPGFGMFLLIGWILDRLVVRQRPADRASKANFVPPRREMPLTRNDPRISPRKIFVAVLSILFISAGALAATSQFLHLYFVKVPVPLVRPLTQIPAKFGPWQQVGGNRSISEDIEKTLGATEYVFRDYLDQRIVGDQAIDAAAQDPMGAAALARTVAMAHPTAVVRLAVTYYTGHVDGVIHQSERCNLAGGIATSIESAPQTWDLGGRPLSVRVVHLINDTRDAPGSRYVTYCYFVNGHEETEAWRVRSMLMNIFDRTAWYAKVEVTTDLSDPAESQRVLSDFLNAALPEIERCLPPMRSADANDQQRQAERGAK